MLRERRVIWRVQGLKREGQVLQLVLGRVSRIPRSLVAEEVLSTPTSPRSGVLVSYGRRVERLGSVVHIPAHIRAMTTACYCGWASLHSRVEVPKDGTPTDPGFSSVYSRVS